MTKDNKLHSSNNKEIQGEGGTIHLNFFTKKERKIRSQRFIELDVLRGFAIIFMIFLHILWDLDYFHIVPLNGTVYQLNIVVPTIFFLLAGICLAVSNNKIQTQSKTKTYLRTIRRGLWILILGMGLTLLTFIFLPDRPILFGVLHCIGLSIILSMPFLRFTSTNIICAILIILAGLTITINSVENPTILQLATGFHQPDLSNHTIDYFPLIPWFGVCLLGIALGNILYKDNKRRFKIPDLSLYKPAKIFSWLGQHSLAIYLVHQPIIAGILSLYILL